MLAVLMNAYEESTKKNNKRYATLRELDNK